MTDAEFAAIFDAHKDAVFQFAWSMIGSRTVAEDIAQEVFLAVLRGKVAFDGKRGSLRALLFGTARHMAWKHWRNDQRWASLEEELPAIVASQLAHLSVSDAVEKAVEALPPLQREALILATYDGLSLEEIAEAAAVEVGTVKARLHRARDNLKRLLAAYKPETAKARGNHGTT